MDFTRTDLARCVDSTALPAFVTDLEGRILAWNRPAEAILGHSREDVLGRPCHQVMRGRDALGNHLCRVDCSLKHRAAEEQPLQRFRMHARAAAGHHVEVECSSLCLRDGAGDAVIIHVMRAHPDGPRSDLGDTPAVPLGPEMSRAADLTNRETEVLRMLATGLGTRQLAGELSISPATVRSHVESILRKLDAHSRLEAVAVARRIGFL